MIMYLAGFQEGYPYPYPHTLYFLETASLRPHRFQPDQLRAKMILFAFGNALLQARRLYGVCMRRRPLSYLTWCWPPALHCLKEEGRCRGIPCLTEDFQGQALPRTLWR